MTAHPFGDARVSAQNPYLEAEPPKPPARRYRVTFLPEGRTFEVDPGQLPYGRVGHPGSLLDVSSGSGETGIDHACGGMCACSTCHVVVREGLSSCNEMTEPEADMLDNAPGVTAHSRLACQTVPDGSCDIIIEIPDWNRNYVRE